MKEIVLDTETTGISLKDGHRIVEIGCIELENLIPTQKKFHCYLNPERKVSEKALEVHGYSDSFLSVQALPATIILFGNIDILEKFLPNLITIPLKVLSLISVFDPAPNIKILFLLPNFFKNETRSGRDSGLK